MCKTIIHVTCAIIEKAQDILIAQRNEKMSNPLKWEFPGGKINKNETIDDCIIREIKEELDINIYIKYKLSSSSFLFDNKEIILYPFICQIESGEINLKEHINIRWLRPFDVYKFDLSPADIPVLDNYINYLNTK